MLYSLVISFGVFAMLCLKVPGGIPIARGNSSVHDCNFVASMMKNIHRFHGPGKRGSCM